MDGAERLLRRRFDAMAGPYDADWGEVRRRARRGSAKVTVVAAAVAVALAAAGLAIGSQVVGLFEVHGKVLPLSTLSPRQREMLVTSLCPHVALKTIPGKAPKAICRDGTPTVAVIANDGSEVHYRITYPWGLTCVGSGPVGGFHDPNRGDFLIGMLGCNAGAPGQQLVPTPKRPITVDAIVGASREEPRMHLIRASGLAGDGIERVALVSREARLVTDVRGHAYSFTKVPDRNWTAIVALDASGNEVYREPVLGGPRRRASPRQAPPPRRPPPQRPRGPLVQRISEPVVSIDVYRNAFVVLRFSSTSSESYRRLARSAATVGGRVGLYCGKVAYGAGRWKDLSAGATVKLAPTLRTTFGAGPFPDGSPHPPYDFCEVSGTYGRYWNDEEGPHEVVEVPFNALGRRYLGERATARDLAYWVRTTKLHRIRLAIHRGERGPSAQELARIFGPRLVPLASSDGTAPDGKVGVWTDGKVIVASELTPAGRRLYVTIDALRIGQNNIRDLSFVY